MSDCLGSIYVLESGVGWRNFKKGGLIQIVNYVWLCDYVIDFENDFIVDKCGFRIRKIYC